jgi:hypothetical protein
VPLLELFSYNLGAGLLFRCGLISLRSNVINKANDDKELDQNIDKILEDIFENIDLDEQEEAEEVEEPVEPEEEKRDDSEEPELSSFFSQYQRSSQ